VILKKNYSNLFPSEDNYTNNSRHICSLCIFLAMATPRKTSTTCRDWSIIWLRIRIRISGLIRL